MRKHDNKHNKIRSNQSDTGLPKELIEDNSCRVKALYVLYFLFLFAAEISVHYAFHNFLLMWLQLNIFEGLEIQQNIAIQSQKIKSCFSGMATARAPPSKRADYSQPEPAPAAADVFGRVRLVLYEVDVCRLRNVCLCLLKVARKRTCVIATIMKGRS